MPGAHKVPNTNFYRAPDHGDDLEAFGRWAADRIERGDRVRGPRHRRRGLPRAGAELRRLLPAAARLLRAGPRDLRPVRRAPGLRRGRSARSAASATMFALRRFGYSPDIITCAKGMTSGYSPIGAMIASDRLVEPFRHGRRLLPARLHLRRPPGLRRGGPGQPRHLRARGPQPARARQRGRVPGHAGEAARPADRRRRPRRRATSTGSSSSRTRPPRRPSTTTSPSGCCAASSPRRSSTPGSTAAPTTAATR